MLFVLFSIQEAGNMEMAQRVREYVRREYIDVARRQHQVTVRVVAGDVHKAVGLSNRVPLVCQALKGRKFLEENHLELEKSEGPKSGLGTKVAFTYRLKAKGASPSPEPETSFVTIRGIGKKLFQSLGGGEAFIRQQRESFYGDGKYQ
jgi:hypothetical protein